MILVTGATGNVGRNVVRELLADGQQVRALTRNPEQAGLPAGVEVVRGDLTDPATLPAALAGVRAAFLFPTPGAAPGFLAAAKQAWVARVVLLSSASVQDGVEEQPDVLAQWHGEIEQAVRASGLEWTILRPGAFAVNALQWAGQLKGGEVIRGAYAEAQMAPIHEADIAAVAAVALVQDGHAGAVHELSGPQSLSHAQQAATVGEVLGRPVSYQELPPEVVREQMLSFHVPEPVIDALFTQWSESLDGPVAVSGAVEKLTGRPGRTFAEWVGDHRADFA
ncbi:NAD(P)H-binding protein [Streptacidiphilus sp. PAMC 29251]